MNPHPHAAADDSQLDRRILLGAAGLAGVAALSSLTSRAAAGPLTPPAGAVASSGKTLAEVEPRTPIGPTTTPGDADSVYKINTPGSYYLTSNFAFTGAKGGIEITASGVTIDLNGFQISSFGGLAGIFTSVTTVERIVIRNGQINLCSAGIDLTAVPGVCIESVNVESNQGVGIAIGQNGRITRCTAKNNTGTGISTDVGAVVTECTAAGNGGIGILADTGSSIVSCSAINNGSRGFVIGVGATARDCSAYQNTGAGFDASVGASLTGCTAYGNSGIGINASQGCVITACTAYDSGSNGITVRHGSVVTGCSSYENTAHGITGAQGVTISNCYARANRGDGIQVFIDSLVLNNVCGNNGTTDGAGIHATSADNRIEGNTCTSSPRGIDVDAGGNFIARNTCSGNTNNWDVVAGNKCLVILAANAAAISGNSGGVSPGSTDPNANFTY